MTLDSINPYRPSVAISEKNLDVVPEIQFRLTHRILRYSESKYLIRSHSSRLMLGSMLIITLSTVIFFVAMYFGALSFFTALIGTMAAASAIYLALVHHAKIEIRQNLEAYGMEDGAACSITMNNGAVIINTPTGTYQWPADKLRTYRTQKGQLLLPQEPLFLIIPKVNESTRGEYKELIKTIKSKAR
ncbi:MAG: hypothetical protein L7W43_11390 [Rubripirellula sp.]|nr:hypothetical protein [Rubripirellula sp.]